MFSVKAFWYGLGTGLITAALLLQLLSVVPADDGSGTTAPDLSQQGDHASTKPDLSELRKQAANLGYQVLDANTHWYSDKDMTAAKKQAQQEALQAAAANAAPERIYVIDVRKGMSSEQIADMLFTVGLFRHRDQRDQFLEQLNEQGLQTKVHADVYSFHEQDSIQRIIQAMTE